MTAFDDMLGGGGVRRTDPVSSHLAAASTPAMQRRFQALAIYKLHAPNPSSLSCDLARALDLDRDSMSPRVKWLRENGRIIEDPDKRHGINMYGGSVALEHHRFVTDNPTPEQVEAAQARERERERVARVARLREEWPLFTAAEQVAQMCEQGAKLSPVQRAAVLDCLQKQQAQRSKLLD